MKKVLSVFLILCLTASVFSGCNGNIENKNNNENTSSVSTPSQVEFENTDEDMFTDRDSKSEYNENNSVEIKLSQSTAKASDASVKISGTTITITKDATHIISGTLDDGMIIVDAPESAKLQIVLDNVSIAKKSSAPLYIKQADKVFITLVGENTLSNTVSFTAIDENNIDGAVFSKQDLTFNGEGSLTVSSSGGHGIVGKDDLVFASGSYNIVSASHGIQANDSVNIKESNITIDCGKDGIHSENTDDSEKGYVYISSGNIKIESEGDGISSSSYIQIADGTIEILAGGGYKNGTKEHSDNFGQFGGGGNRPGGRPGSTGSTDRNTEQLSATAVSDSDSSSSMKGIKSESSMLISGGTFKIDSADDALHSNLSLTINGGSFEIASGDDALHAEDTLSVTEGKINITNSYEGLEALHISLSGGEIKLIASDDGLNAAGGTDNSGAGGRDNMFGGRPGGQSSNSNGSIVISGGNLYINASGDGIDANGTLEISGGFTTVVGPTQGDTATLDYDKTAIISGGTFIGTGASTMAQSFSSSKQGVIALSVGNQSAGTKIILKDKNDKELISYSPELSYQIIILSTPEMKSGEDYKVTVGTQSGTFEAN